MGASPFGRGPGPSEVLSRPPDKGSNGGPGLFGLSHVPSTSLMRSHRQPRADSPGGPRHSPARSSCLRPGQGPVCADLAVRADGVEATLTGPDLAEDREVTAKFR
jgi:hypothetical protein